MNIIVLAFALYFFYSNVKGQEDYNIIAPELICDSTNNLNAAKRDVTSIRILGDGNLDFKLNFKRTSKKCRNTQRCNLIAWKVIREFEKYLNDYPYTQTNSIDFNNNMLIPGLQYIVNIVVTKGKTKEEKQLSLNFVDDNYLQAADKIVASISLIGTVSAEPHALYVLNADTTICSNIIGFYFQWDLLDSNNNLIENFSDRSSELNIAPFTFRDGENYIIKCALINIENNESIAKTTHTVYVKTRRKALIVKLPMVYTTVKVQQPINIQTYIMDLQNTDGDIKFQWSCVYDNENVCKNYGGNEHELIIEEGFLNEGEYNITLKVTKDSEETVASCIIKVFKDIPSIEIDAIEFSIFPSRGMDIKANVYGLRTFCTLQWQSEEGPYLNLSALPGEKPYRVIAKRDLFLSEFEEISSDLTNKEFHLKISPPSGPWQGLPNLDQNYKLQVTLKAKCPKAQMDDYDIEVEYSEEMLNDTITVTALVEVEVNVAPRLKALEIEPLSGIALETIFAFKTREAVKTGDDGPFLYRFGYVLGDREFIFSNMLGFTQSETVLPYSEDGVKTFLEACDGFNSCEKLFGPIVNTTLPVTIDKRNVLVVFDEKLNTEDFYKAFGYGLSILCTARSLGEADIFMNYSAYAILSTIQSLENSYKSDEAWSKRVSKLIKYISEFSEEYLFSDDILDSLVELRSILLAAQRENLNYLRQLLAVAQRKSTVREKVESYLEVSDLIINRSHDKRKVEAEKVHFSQKVMEYIGKLCVELYKSEENIVLEFKSAIIVLEKLPKKAYSNYHLIPFQGNPWNTTVEVKFNAEALDKTGQEKLCVSKTIFRDFFNKTGIIYGANIWNGVDGSPLENINNTIVMPIDIHQVTGKTPKCMAYNNNSEWLPSCKLAKPLSDTEYVQCICTSLGSFYLEYEENIASTTAVTYRTNSLTTDPYIGDITRPVETTGLNSNQVPTEINTVDNSAAPNSSDDSTDMSSKLDSNHVTTVQDSLITEILEVEVLTTATNVASIPSIETEEIDSNTKTIITTEQESAATTMSDANLSTIKKSELTTIPALKKTTMEDLPSVPTTSTPITVLNSLITDVVEVDPLTTAASEVPIPSTDTEESASNNKGIVTTEKESAVTTMPDASVSTIKGSELTTIPASKETTMDYLSSVSTTLTPTTENSTDDLNPASLATSTSTSTRETIVDVLLSSIATDPSPSPTEKVSTWEPPVDGNVPDDGNTMTVVRFLTTPLSTAYTNGVTKTATERKPAESWPQWGFIQGGFQANFNAGFSVGFSFNTTHG